MIRGPELGIPGSAGGCAGFTCPLYHAYRVVQESVLAGGPSRECSFAQYDFGRDEPEVSAEWGAF